MKAPLHIIHLEDNAGDAELVQSLLEVGKIPCHFTCVHNREDFLAALAQERVDLILSDYALPQFDGLSALELTRERRPEAPFIFISGTIGDKVTAEVFKKGATDYLLKDHLSRLSSSVK